jgi:hypothetical protein
MGRYTTQASIVSDNTTKAGFSCVRTCTISPGGYSGTCVFHLTGGSNGTASTGNYGAGNCLQWTVPNGITTILIEIWGGGGGGASSDCSCCSVTTGGGGGAYARSSTLSVTAGQQYTLCAGSGACGSRWIQSGCIGSKGVTTYVTGPGLTNFCAEGGYGGLYRTLPGDNGQSMQVPNGGFPGSGGILNIRGYDGGMVKGSSGSGNWCMGFNYGGGSPFGGRNMYIGYDYCAQYADYQGGGKSGGVCGFTGSFPGGGGTGSWPSCCCTYPSHGGDGSPGLIRIWM